MTKQKPMNNQAHITMLDGLISENQNPDTIDIDQLSSLNIVKKINQQDHKVSKAISLVLPEIAAAVDNIVAAFKAGGRLVYIGAGTSGRLGVLDAVECIPTFGIEEGMVIGLMAGGKDAMYKAKEGVEDSFDAGKLDLESIGFNKSDVLVGIAASGRTPYVIGALKHAGQVGAKRISLSCNPQAEISLHAEINLLPIVGAEALTGSTRMKSGTAQKLVLNMLSTASMIRIGKSYKNLMVDVKATNKKLYARGTRMIMQVTGATQLIAEQTLEASGMQVKLAILMLLAGVDAKSGQALLQKTDGFLSNAISHSQKS
jgi:N-acetylmuramic acid 6-phosphate etherase